MEHKVFLDANIVLDLLSSERPNHARAKKLIRTLIEQNARICISEDIITTVYYIAQNKQQALAFFQAVQKRWQMLSFGHKVIAKALGDAMEHAYDLEDTLQCLCAREHGCTLIVTEDRGFVPCGVEVKDYEGVLT
jgi:predicted nucleic acid-binding protein